MPTLHVQMIPRPGTHLYLVLADCFAPHQMIRCAVCRRRRSGTEREPGFICERCGVPLHDGCRRLSAPIQAINFFCPGCQS